MYNVQGAWWVRPYGHKQGSVGDRAVENQKALNRRCGVDHREPEWGRGCSSTGFGAAVVAAQFRRVGAARNGSVVVRHGRSGGTVTNSAANRTT